MREKYKFGHSLSLCKRETNSKKQCPFLRLMSWLFIIKLSYYFLVIRTPHPVSCVITCSCRLMGTEFWEIVQWCGCPQLSLQMVELLLLELASHPSCDWRALVLSTRVAVCEVDSRLSLGAFHLCTIRIRQKSLEWIWLDLPNWGWGTSSGYLVSNYVFPLLVFDSWVWPFLPCVFPLSILYMVIMSAMLLLFQWSEVQFLEYLLVCRTFHLSVVWTFSEIVL